jgi:hypothetical protein
VPRFFVFVKDFSSKSALELLRDRAMDRIRVIEELLWPQVPADVIEEAKQTAQAEPTWIAMEATAMLSRQFRLAAWTVQLAT